MTQDLDVWRQPPVYRLLSSAMPLHGKHMNKVWSGLVHREGSSEPGVPMVIKWMPKQVPLLTELACSMAAAALKLPVPAGGLVLCPNDQLPELPKSVTTDTLICFGSHLQFGDGAFARLVSDDAAVEEHTWRRLCETPNAASGAAMDELIANGDRHYENVLFDGDRWWLFDHEKALEPISRVMKRFAQQVVRQALVEHRAGANILAHQLTERRPGDHGIDGQVGPLQQRRQRLQWMASAVRDWQTGNSALDEMFPIVEVVLRSIDMRLPALALHLQRRFNKSDASSLWNSSSPSPITPRPSRRRPT